MYVCEKPEFCPLNLRLMVRPTWCVMSIVSFSSCRNQFASPGKPEIPQWQRTSTEHTQATSNDVQEGVKDSVEESSN